MLHLFHHRHHRSPLLTTATPSPFGVDGKRHPRFLADDLVHSAEQLAHPRLSLPILLDDREGLHFPFQSRQFGGVLAVFVAAPLKGALVRSQLRPKPLDSQVSIERIEGLQEDPAVWGLIQEPSQGLSGLPGICRERSWDRDWAGLHVHALVPSSE